MKIFVALPEKFAGCGFYRQYQPHNRLAKIYNIDVLFMAGIQKPNGETIDMDFDIAFFHKGFFDFDAIKKFKEAGTKVIVDFDDWWRLDTEHVFYKNYHNDGTSETLVKLLRESDYVTCTTERLANEIIPINQNVCVLPNAMDMNYPGCTVNRIPEDKIVFGYVGGHCHGKDVYQLHGVNNQVAREFNNYKFRLMGVDGTEIYNQYSMILSDNGYLANTHFDWSEKADIWNYPKFYNLMDVSLVPLMENKFNSLKSELKLIEAGFFKKAVVVDNVHPYRDLIKHKVNAMVVNKRRDWADNIKYLLRNTSAITELGEALYETVQGYDIDKVNEKRYKFYTDVLKDNDTNSSNRYSRLQNVR